MNGRVLVAEPSRTLTTLIRLTLAVDPLELEFVADGHDALTRARQLRPELLIADAGLPGLDGYALAAAIHANPGLEELPVLLTIADYEEPDADRMEHAGIHDVLTKPFERFVLLERVRALIGSRTGAASPRRGPGPGPARVAAGPSAGLTQLEVESIVEQTVARYLDQSVPALLEHIVGMRLDSLVEARLSEAVATLSAPLLEAAVDSAVARSLPDVLEHAAYGLGPQVEEALAARLPELLGKRVEKVVWKIVPEMAEDLIREEITRLTAELDEATE